MNSVKPRRSLFHTITSKILPARFAVGKDKAHIVGQINSSVFAYVTPLMILIAIVISFIVISAFDTLMIYFNTNVGLNGLIIFLIILALFTIFRNNFNLYKTARFMKTIEGLMDKPVIHDEDVSQLHRQLEKEIALMNTKQMQDCISNLTHFGHLNFTDKDAMLIKSKLGYRLGLQRSGSNFNSGILVMLGLLGTFLGLLKTIDAVGEALNSMSSIGGDSGEITMEDMSNFIGSLAAPLNGMGLAFSSSLFGLSGSLLVGFFSHLSTGAQNNFVEDTSRWIDNRIPKFNPEKSQTDSSNKQANQDDLKHWLAGYVHLSVKTNKQIAHLSQTILGSLEQADATRSALTAVAGAQEQLTHRLDITTQSLNTISEQNNALISGLAQSYDSLSDMKDVIDVNTRDIGAKLDTLPDSLSHALNHSLSGALDTSLNNALHVPLNAINVHLTNLEHAMTQGHNALLEQLQNTSALQLIEERIDEARKQIDTANRGHSTKMEAQTVTFSRLENIVQTGLAQLQNSNGSDVISGQLSDIQSSLLALNTTLKAQSKVLADRPAATPSPIYSPPLRATEATRTVPPVSSDATQMQDDVQSMLDDIEKDENNFFKNFFGVKPDKES